MISSVFCCWCKLGVDTAAFHHHLFIVCFWIVYSIRFGVYMLRTKHSTVQCNEDSTHSTSIEHVLHTWYIGWSVFTRSASPQLVLSYILCDAKISTDPFYAFINACDSNNKFKSNVVVVDWQILLWIKHVEHRQQFLSFAIFVFVLVRVVCSRCCYYCRCCVGLCVRMMLFDFYFPYSFQLNMFTQYHVCACGSVRRCLFLSLGSMCCMAFLHCSTVWTVFFSHFFLFCCIS